MKYRRSVDIIAKILDAALSGETKSQIMMCAHPNHIQIKRYMPHVLSEELMEERENPADSSAVYAATEKGRIFLQKYTQVQLYRIE